VSEQQGVGEGEGLGLAGVSAGAAPLLLGVRSAPDINDLQAHRGGTCSRVGEWRAGSDYGLASCGACCTGRTDSVGAMVMVEWALVPGSEGRVRRGFGGLGSSRQLAVGRGR